MMCFKNYLLILYFVISFNKALSRSDETSPSPKAFFYISHEKAAFFEAAAICFNLSMELSSIDNQWENEELALTIKNSLQDGDVADFWIGATSLVDGSIEEFTWYPSGKPLTYNNLVNKKPLYNNCVKFQYAPSGSHWRQEDCFQELRFVCKQSYSNGSFMPENPMTTNRWGIGIMGGAFIFMKKLLVSIGVVETTGRFFRNAIKWIKEKIGFNSSLSFRAIANMENIFAVIRKSMSISGWTAGQPVSKVKAYLEAAAYQIGHSLRWRKIKIRRILRLTRQAIDHIFDAVAQQGRAQNGEILPQYEEENEKTSEQDDDQNEENPPEDENENEETSQEEGSPAEEETPAEKETPAEEETPEAEGSPAEVKTEDS